MVAASKDEALELSQHGSDGETGPSRFLVVGVRVWGGQWPAGGARGGRSVAGATRRPPAPGAGKPPT